MENLTNKYNNNIIVINRGDSFSFDLTLEDDNSKDGRYHLVEDDTIYMGIMVPGQRFEDALIRKKYTVDDCDEMGNLIISIDPEDTIDLYPGTYYYAVKLKMDHEYIDPNTKEHTGEYIDKVITVISKTKFFVCD